MCGIAGHISFTKHPIDPFAINLMTESLSHRGPDATGYFNDEGVSLGHKRLSVIDLTDCSNQPMSDFSNRYTIVYNGEIYNYRAIREMIPGYPYKTQGDTEVILAAFEKWGPNCVKYLEGMFAFAIWDKEKSKLFLARDRMGIKPLYFFESDEFLLFASETRSLLASKIIRRKINLKAVLQFLRFESVAAPETMIQDIMELPAGTYIEFDGKKRSITKYWEITYKDPGIDLNNYSLVKQTVQSLLQAAVNRRMVADVPIGAFLSGGIDSSAIVGLMASASANPINTFTIGFNEKEYDETEYANIISKQFNTRHQNIKVLPQTFLDELLPALNAMDCPTGDGINSYVISRSIRQTGIRVAMSGAGGDELFAGYPFFKQYLQLTKCWKYWEVAKPLRKFSAQILKNREGKSERFRQLILAKPDIANVYPVLRQIVPPLMLKNCTNLTNEINEPSELLKQNLELIETFPLLSQVSIAEYYGYTENTLIKDLDQMSMASALEVREPFFDHSLIEFVLTIPDKFKLQKFPKQLLTESLGFSLPSEIVQRKKKGFLFPWEKWMKNELRSFCELHIKNIGSRKFINGDQLLIYWNKFLKNDNSVRWMEIWLFVVLEHWLQHNEID